jgi:hypothetical protein
MRFHFGRHPFSLLLLNPVIEMGERTNVRFQINIQLIRINLSWPLKSHYSLSVSSNFKVPLTQYMQVFQGCNLIQEQGRQTQKREIHFYFLLRGYLLVAVCLYLGFRRAGK